MKEFLKEFGARLTSRKFIVAVAAALTAYGVAVQDNVITQGEVWTILTPVLAFIGVEGAADTVTRVTNVPKVEESAPSSTESEA